MDHLGKRTPEEWDGGELDYGMWRGQTVSSDFVARTSALILRTEGEAAAGADQPLGSGRRDALLAPFRRVPVVPIVAAVVLATVGAAAYSATTQARQPQLSSSPETQGKVSIAPPRMDFWFERPSTLAEVERRSKAAPPTQRRRLPASLPPEDPRETELAPVVPPERLHLPHCVCESSGVVCGCSE